AALRAGNRGLPARAGARSCRGGWCAPAGEPWLTANERSGLFGLGIGRVPTEEEGGAGPVGTGLVVAAEERERHARVEEAAGQEGELADTRCVGDEGHAARPVEAGFRRGEGQGEDSARAGHDHAARRGERRRLDRDEGERPSRGGL